MFRASVWGGAFAMAAMAISTGVRAADTPADDYVVPPPADVPLALAPRAAVSSPNGKLELGYGWNRFEFAPGVPGFDEAETHNLQAIGSFSMPVGRQFGVQVDAGIAGSIAGTSLSDPALTGFSVKPRQRAYGIGAHAFWRDPDLGLVGAYGHFVRLEQDFSSGGATDRINADVFRLGVAGEYYQDSVSLEGFVGADFMSATASGGASADATFVTARAIAAYYPNPDTRVFAGLEYAFEDITGLVGGEFLINPDSPVATAAYLEGSFGRDTTTVEAGLRIYFAPIGKHLIARHREDDPRAFLFDTLGAMSGCANSLMLGEIAGVGEETATTRTASDAAAAPGFSGTCGSGTAPFGTEGGGDEYAPVTAE
ncbi:MULTISPECIES: hypothetical protein [unclassified Roseitalea]|uniref:hypothetical protein n=1 Tax=unclassified Roseitalea TaxID=2639107 RepID=UPI00273E92B3|nr:MULTISPECIES: hypothetical protein [unclassified Roseitalea]